MDERRQRPILLGAVLGTQSIAVWITNMTRYFSGHTRQMRFRYVIRIVRWSRSWGATVKDISSILVNSIRTPISSPMRSMFMLCHVLSTMRGHSFPRRSHRIFRRHKWVFRFSNRRWMMFTGDEEALPEGVERGYEKIWLQKDRWSGEETFFELFAARRWPNMLHIKQSDCFGPTTYLFSPPGYAVVTSTQSVIKICWYRVGISFVSRLRTLSIRNG